MKCQEGLQKMMLELRRLCFRPPVVVEVDTGERPSWTSQETWATDPALVMCINWMLGRDRDDFGPDSVLNLR